MTLSEMKQVLARDRIQLSRALGQNFLHDGNQLRRIVDSAELAWSDKVLEIGPGLGPLTELLVQQAGTVLAIEKDGKLVDYLQRRFKTGEASGVVPASEPEPGRGCALRILQADALDYLREQPQDWSDWKLVANLPYSVASPILVELAQAAAPPERLVVTLQLEVVERLVARAGERDYGQLSLLVQLRYEPRGWFKIPPACFYPVPEVDSACVRLQRRAQPLLPAAQAATFTRLVKRGFSQRRKMMLKLLKAEWPLPRLEAAFDRLNLSRQTRAEAVSLEQFVQLAGLMAGPPP